MRAGRRVPRAALAAPGDAVWFEQLALPAQAVCGTSTPADDADTAEWRAARAAWDDALRDLFPRDPIPAGKSAGAGVASGDGAPPLSSDTTTASTTSPSITWPVTR
ncbi:MAG: hypothetical protein ACO3CC_10545, partial [Alphaproteobacteria bacterium]